MENWKRVLMMKIFLSWSPVPPDPPFWKWIQVDGIVVSIALLKQENLLEKATLVGLHEFLKFNGCIFLDSGSYEDFIADKKLRPNTPEELVALAKWLRVDLVAHSDIPFIGQCKTLPEEMKWSLLEQNIFNAKLAHAYSRGSKSRTRIVYVVQGWDRESLAYCCEALAHLDADYYALGSLLGLQPKEIIHRVRLVRSIIKEEAKLHLFAVSNALVIKKVKSLVDSVDSSSASIAGAMKEIIRPSGGRVNINYAKWMMKCDCPVCRKYRGAIYLQGREGTQNYYNQLRKIHNAYQLLRNLRQIVNTKVRKN
jgi:tRNA-guanine family transglycosylase